jgi:hypothetical protein
LGFAWLAGRFSGITTELIPLNDSGGIIAQGEPVKPVDGVFYVVAKFANSSVSLS